MKIEITVIHSGLLAETFYNGSYYHKLYIGCTKQEARKLFREYVKAEESKYFYEEKAK